MQWNIKDLGDPFEKNCLPLINSKLRNYNVFWSLYVGNKNAKPVDINGITKEFNTKRLLIAQWNYTFLRNVFTTEVLRKRNEDKQVKNVINIINQEIDFLLATHLLFNTIELVDKINSQIGKPLIRQKYNAFIELRNHLTHNIRPKIKFIDNYS